MLIQFDQLPSEARVWIYTSYVRITLDQQQIIAQKITDFITVWESHGKPLKAAFSIIYDQFVVIGVDESFCTVGGCSTDKLIHLIKEVDDKYQLGLLDHSKIGYQVNQDIYVDSMSVFKKKIQEKAIDLNTYIFSPLISKKNELKDAWLMPLHQSWLVKYVK